MERINSLIVEVGEAMAEDDKYYDNYDACAKKSLSELKTIHAWCQILEMKRKEDQDLSENIVYDFKMSDSIVPYDF